MFDQIAMDATRYEYPLSLFSIKIDDLKGIRRRWSYLSGDEAIRTMANYLRRELRETDLLVRYATDEFVALCPRMNREQAEVLKSRLQNELDHFRLKVRPQTEIAIPASIGIAEFPEDGIEIEALLALAEWRMYEDLELRTAVKRRVRSQSSSS
jgi:diguanylate cyclase (GGDEF)-like protein